MRGRQNCVDCGKASPETETNYTLISAECGWRLTRIQSPSGLVIHWRCPLCWRTFKDAQAARKPASGRLSEPVQPATPRSSRQSAAVLAARRTLGSR